jgi:RNA polymerase sigma factor (sigma-70 family)
MWTVVTTEMIDAERAMLVRYCASLTHDLDVAEDLAQASLIEAWRHEAELRDPRARAGWLLRIARNQWLMWARKWGREQTGGGERTHEASLSDLPDPVDLEIELERDELAGLLDRAMALLPQETRDVLVRRYVEEAPQAEIATYLGLSEGAVEARLHRGKLALKRILTNELSDDAMALGLIDTRDAGWNSTSLWCPGCGVRRLEAQLDGAAGTLKLVCPGCVLPYNRYIDAAGDVLIGARTIKPALSRVLQSIHHMFRVQLEDARYVCPLCGDDLPLQRHSEYAVGITCPRCRWRDFESWHSLTWSVPAVREFWREHPRMQFLSVREIEVDGAAALVTGFESMIDRSRIEVVMLLDTLKIVRVARSPQRG